MEKRIIISRSADNIIMKIEDEGQELTATMDNNFAVHLAAELLHAVIEES